MNNSYMEGELQIEQISKDLNHFEEREMEVLPHANNSFDKFITFIRKRLRDDWDIVIALTGEEGSGKSTLAVQLAKKIDKKFDIENNVAYLPDPSEIFDKFNNNVRRYGAFVIDEAVKVLHKHKWFDRLQQEINELYATERYQNKATVLCIPRFATLTENFRNHRVKIWIHVISRGKAICYIKDNDKDIGDPWHMKENQKVKERFFKNRSVASIDVKSVLSAERQTKGYLFDFIFPDLTEEEREEYRNLKILSREKIAENLKKNEEENISKYEKKARRRMITLTRYLKEVEGMKLKDIASIIDMDISDLSNLLNKNLDVGG